MTIKDIDILLKQINILKQHLKERDDTIVKLRNELSVAQQRKANKKWVELDD
jgi:hypothetical protein